MPELPDVERFRRILDDHAVGRRLSEIVVRDRGVIRGRSSSDFVRVLKGQTVVRSERRGKWLLARTGGPTLLMHFGMTGSLVPTTSRVPPDKFDRVIFVTGAAELRFRDQRKLRGLWLTENESGIAQVIGRQGPDALGLGGVDLFAQLEGHRGALKSLLMDQHVIAGLGNMISDEVLWRARIHPSRAFGDLAPEERRSLDRSLAQVLRTSVRAGQTPRTKTWLTAQRGSVDPRCPRGHGPLQTSRIGGRTAYWCAQCQASG